MVKNRRTILCIVSMAFLSFLTLNPFAMGDQVKAVKRCIRVHSTCAPDSPEARLEAAREYAVTGEFCYEQNATCEFLKSGKCGWKIKNAESLKKCLDEETRMLKNLDTGK